MPIVSPAYSNSRRREILEIAREALFERAPENGKVARGRHLLVVGQARRVAIDRARHPELMRLARHHLGERTLVSADRLGDRDSHVIGRTGHHGLDRVVDADRLSGSDAELGGLLCGRVLRDRNTGLEGHGALFKLLEQQIKRHHLGDRGRMPQPVLGDAVERAPAVGVDHDGGKRRGRGNRRPAAAAGVARVMHDVPIVMRACVTVIIVDVPVVVGFRRRASQGERNRGDQGSGHLTDNTNELGFPLTPRHERAPLYARNRRAVARYTHLNVMATQLRSG